MTEFLFNYGIFLAKLGTVVVLLLILIFAVVFLYMRARGGGDEHLEVKNINQKYEQMQLMLKSAILPKKEFKKNLKEVKAKHKSEDKQEKDESDRPRIFVLDFDGDIRASDVASLREEITALLTIANDKDQVFVRLESGGGLVHGYGLAASQLKRITDKAVRLTVAVDKVAASGGYMMACVADRILAAPFAILGSIGVVAQLPNFNRWLKKNDIDFEMITAGEYKRTLTIFGENTDKGREKFVEEIEDVHLMFKEFVAEHRPGLDIEGAATGETWFGQRALKRGLVDELITSDEYITGACDRADVFEVRYVERKTLPERFGVVLQDSADRLLLKWWERGTQARFFS